MNICTQLLLLNYLITVMTNGDIIIIGAGPSGIAAGTSLLENGIENFKILEAESRIGGRINTVAVDGTKIDLGAQWCEGQRGNIVYDKLVELELLELLQRDHFPRQFYSSGRSNISYEFSTELNKIFKDIEGDFKGSNESLGAVLEKRYSELISEKYANNPEKLHFAQLAKDFLSHVVLGVGGSPSWNDIAAHDPDVIKIDGYTSGWKNGYASFLDVLTKKYPNPKNQLPIDEKIFLNKEVTKITYNDTDTEIKILCSDNSIYTGKHVILTISLGILKEKGEHLFEPKLPITKINAIRNIGYGSVLKVFVTFKTKWWGNLPGFNFIWSEEDKAVSRQKFTDGPKNEKGESWIVEHYQIFAIENSNILLVWFTGKMVPLIETMEEDILKSGIHFTLNLFLGNLYNIQKPEKLIRSTWYSNPHFRGTNSFTSLNSSTEDRTNLQKPIKNFNGKPIIQFAGEATNIHHPSCVHGAIESGFTEADRLIKFYRQNRSLYKQ